MFGTIEYSLPLGQPVSVGAERAVFVALVTGENVVFTFNGLRQVVTPAMRREEVVERYFTKKCPVSESKKLSQALDGNETKGQLEYTAKLEKGIRELFESTR